MRSKVATVIPGNSYVKHCVSIEFIYIFTFTRIVNLQLNIAYMSHFAPRHVAVAWGVHRSMQVEVNNNHYLTPASNLAMSTVMITFDYSITSNLNVKCILVLDDEWQR